MAMNGGKGTRGDRHMKVLVDDRLISSHQH